MLYPKLGLASFTVTSLVLIGAVLTANALPGIRQGGHNFGRSVAVSDRGLVIGEPTRFRPDPAGPELGVQAWAGPWPIDELWWDPDGARQVARFQLVGLDGSAWLMLVEQGEWWTEARYD